MITYIHHELAESNSRIERLQARIEQLKSGMLSMDEMIKLWDEIEASKSNQEDIVSLHKHMAFDLDDTLLNTGEQIKRILRRKGLPVIDEREPYNSLRHLLNEGLISPEDYDWIFAQAADEAEPIEKTVNLLRETIATYDEAHIVSTRAHMNTAETLNSLGKILSSNEIFKVKIHWAKAPNEAVRKAVEEQGLGDAKVYYFKKLVELGITHFVDDLGFNIKAIVENVPELTPIWVKQPWVIDKRYVPELMDHPRVEFLDL